MIRASRLLLVAVLTLSLGLHWAVLQTLAWTGMVITYTQETSSLQAAIARTFDGAHPCKLCKFVSEGKKAEQKQEVQKPVQKFDAFLIGKSLFFFPPTQVRSEFASAPVLRYRPVTPPAPPPKQA